VHPLATPIRQLETYLFGGELTTARRNCFPICALNNTLTYLLTCLLNDLPCHGKLTGGAVASDGRTIAHLFLDDAADDSSLLAISVALVDIGTKPSISDHLTATGVLIPNPLADALHHRNISDLQPTASLEEMNYCVRIGTLTPCLETVA